jgi:hypothetical protein
VLNGPAVDGSALNLNIHFHMPFLDGRPEPERTAGKELQPHDGGVAGDATIDVRLK